MKIKKILLVMLMALTLCACGDEKEKEIALPKPEVSEGVRGDLGIDANVNEETIDKYLDREDAVYRDMRRLVDPGN